MQTFHATTILTVRDNNQVAIGGDGQVSLGETIAKADAVKVRKLNPTQNHEVLVGFAGSAADAFALLDKFEARLADSPGNIKKAAIELAKLWRTDRALRRLESLLAVADSQCSLLISGSGDVIEPTDGILAIGSGGNYALSAARALKQNTDMNPEQIVAASMKIAGEICVYTNLNTTVLTL